MASGDRWKSYKTKGNVEEGRRRREEEGLQLRKAKREEEISKRRNINVDVEDATVSLHDKAGQEGSKVPTIQELINDLLSPQPSTVLASATFIRKLLAKENPPIAEVVESGVIPLFVQFLGRDHQCTLQFESCWVLTNVASGSSLHTKVVVDAGAVPSLIRLLHSPFVNVQEQAVWALGNITGDNVQFREFVLENGILDPLLLIFKSSSASGVLMKHATWTLSNLCRGKNPPLKSEYAARCLPILSQLLYHDNLNVISDTCWSLSFLADGSNKRIQQVIDAGVVMRLVELLMHPVKDVVSPALRCIGNLVTGDDVQTQVVLNCSVLSSLEYLCKSSHEGVRKEACWTISNIAAGNKVQIQTLIDSGVIPVVLDIMSTAEFKTRKEAVWAVCNAISGGTPEQIKYLVRLGVIGPLCDMLLVQSPKLVTVVLECLGVILKVGKLEQDRYHGVNPFAVKVEEVNGLEKIESLQSHVNESIYKLAYKLIDTHFDVEDNDENVVPDQSHEQYVFAPKANLPPGGFQF